MPRPELGWDHHLDAPPPRPGDDWLRPAAAWRAAWVDQAQELAESGSNSSAEAPGSSNGPGGRAIDAVIRLALRQGFVVTREQAEAMGLTRAAIRARLDRQTWSQSRRGAFAVIHPGVDTRQRAALQASAAALTRRDAVISHASAAVLHGLPVRSLPVQPMLTVPAGVNSGVRQLSSVHRAALGVNDVGSWFGAPVTSVARTVADLARADRGAGLMAADAALRERLATTIQLMAAASACAGWPGSTGARWVAAHAVALAESPLESLVRACLLDAGLPAPQLQARVSDPADGWSARVDLLWPRQRVVLEADGQVKYSGDTGALWREKRRQERLERLGYRVVRLLWSDVIDQPPVTVERVRRALAGD